MWLGVRYWDNVQRGSVGLLPLHTTHPSSLSDDFQVAPGHYISSRNFSPIRDAVYWDAEYPDKVDQQYLGF